MSAISHGTPVVVTDASGVEHAATAVSSLEGGQGHSFPVIWVAFGSNLDDRRLRIPWPAESVRVADAAEKEQS